MCRVSLEEYTTWFQLSRQGSFIATDTFNICQQGHELVWFAFRNVFILSSVRICWDLRSGHPTCTFRQRVAIIWKQHGQAVSSALPLLRAANRGSRSGKRSHLRT